MIPKRFNGFELSRKYVETLILISFELFFVFDLTNEVHMLSFLYLDKLYAAKHNYLTFFANYSCPKAKTFALH
jgi:hypothetical protein